MNYIYDILVNFKYPLQDFYEWNKMDDIKNIKKIPVYKVTKKIINDFKKNKIVVNDILDEINSLTQIYGNRKNKIINYACIITDDDEALAIMFNKKGLSIGKSRLLLDEEQEILFMTRNMDIKDIKYNIIEKDNINLFKTIKEVNMQKYIIKEIKKIEDINKLNYIYYECFNNICTNPKQDLLLSIEDKWDEVGEKIYNFLKLTSINKV